ncbi:capsular biosynthesis protein [Acidihalobacter aeolianus]|uniref:Capsular biosynthesis protein n=1 Tax=Acidihalobacter aeolianus TaxID=2792603 RepID=A0A1D8KCB4_9GAMM|nr:capsular biosynthesis protein [Acidihalobacter aeolianus]
MKNTARVLALVGGLASLAGCAGFLPHDGPTAGAISDVASNQKLSGIQLVNVNYAVARHIKQQLDAPRAAMLKAFANPHPDAYTLGPGDVVEVYIWEAPPAMLFTPAITATTVPSGAIMTSIPQQMVGTDGNIVIPFAGMIPCDGKTPNQIAAEVRQHLMGLAHDPQVVVKLVNNHAQSISVVGNVKQSRQVPMIPGGVTILQALAAAGGVVHPVSKITLQIARDGNVLQLPLMDVIRNPMDNISLRAGDVLTALYRPLHVTAMGATMQAKEIDFEATGISLAQALARSGGLNTNQADARAVYVFRFESPTLLPHWPEPVKPLPDGKIPVVFRFDLSNPATFFAAQTFPIQNHDLIFVATAPSQDFSKFLNLIVQIVYPFQTLNALGVIK